MKQLPNPYSYSDYREYIKDALKALGLTYKQFCTKHSKVVGLPALGQMLSNRNYRMGLETYHGILKTFRLNEREEAHLTLLRIENDIVSSEKSSEGARATLKNLLDLNRSSDSTAVTSTLSSESLQMAEAFEILPDYLKERIINETISIFHVFKARHPKRATINHALTSLAAIRNSRRKK
jgi:hypothetical protein